MKRGKQELYVKDENELNAHAAEHRRWMKPALHVNSAAPPLSGPGLEMLARQYMEVQAIIKRWARRYDARLLEQLIYMPVVTAAEFDRADWMRDWTRELEQHLNAPRDSPRSYRVELRQVDGHPPRVLVSKTEHGSITEKALPQGILRLGRIPAHRRARQDAGRHDRRGRLRHPRRRSGETWARSSRPSPGCSTRRARASPSSATRVSAR